MSRILVTGGEGFYFAARHRFSLEKTERRLIGRGKPECGRRGYECHKSILHFQGSRPKFAVSGRDSREASKRLKIIARFSRNFSRSAVTAVNGLKSELGCRSAQGREPLP